MSGDFAEVLVSAPNLEFVDIADTAITAADDAAAAAAISAAAALTHYHVGGAAFVPVLGAEQRGGRGGTAKVDKVEVVVTLRESINFFCGGCPDSVMQTSSMADCGRSLCADQLRLKALDCAVAHAVTAAAAAAAAAAGEKAPAADAQDEAFLVSEDDVRRESILSYATTRAHAGNGDVMVVKLTVTLRAPVTTAAASSIADSLSALESLDTPAACGALVNPATATDRFAISDRVQWRLPTAVVTAQPACGTGVMGRACAYICPAEWIKDPAVQSDVFAVYTAGSGVSDTDAFSREIINNKAGRVIENTHSTDDRRCVPTNRYRAPVLMYEHLH
jgi:hypothetical protein